MILYIYINVDYQKMTVTAKCDECGDDDDDDAGGGGGGGGDNTTKR